MGPRFPDVASSYPVITSAELAPYSDWFTIDIDQFLVANFHERALFQKANHRPQVEQLIACYNELIKV